MSNTATIRFEFQEWIPNEDGHCTFANHPPDGKCQQCGCSYTDGILWIIDRANDVVIHRHLCLSCASIMGLNLDKAKDAILAFSANFAPDECLKS